MSALVLRHDLPFVWYDWFDRIPSFVFEPSAWQLPWHQQQTSESEELSDGVPPSATGAAAGNGAAVGNGAAAGNGAAVGAADGGGDGSGVPSEASLPPASS